MPVAITLPLYVVAFAGLLAGLTIVARSRRKLPYRRLRLVGLVLALIMAAAHAAAGIASRGSAEAQALRLLLLLALALGGLIAALPDLLDHAPQHPTVAADSAVEPLAQTESRPGRR